MSSSCHNEIKHDSSGEKRETPGLGNVSNDSEQTSKSRLLNREDSQKLELVLEYTEKIKAFLGFDVDVTPDVSQPCLDVAKSDCSESLKFELNSKKLLLDSNSGDISKSFDSNVEHLFDSKEERISEISLQSENKNITENTQELYSDVLSGGLQSDINQRKRDSVLSYGPSESLCEFVIEEISDYCKDIPNGVNAVLTGKTSNTILSILPKSLIDGQNSNEQIDNRPEEDSVKSSSSSTETQKLDTASPKTIENFNFISESFESTYNPMNNTSSNNSNFKNKLEDDLKMEKTVAAKISDKDPSIEMSEMIKTDLDHDIYETELQDEDKESELIRDSPVRIPGLRRFSADVAQQILERAGSEILSHKIDPESQNGQHSEFGSETNISTGGRGTPIRGSINKGFVLQLDDVQENLSSEIPDILKNDPHSTEKEQRWPSKQTLEKKEFEMYLNKKELEKYYEDEDTICGFGSYQPRWMQKLATPRTYLVLYSIIGVLSGSYYSYLVGIMSTLEKRFAFKSKLSGTIMTMDELTPLFLGVLIGYIGGKVHRPRMLGFGMMMAVACCFLSAAPYFIYGAAIDLKIDSKASNTAEAEICDLHSSDACNLEDRPPTLIAVLLLMIGSFLKGFGNMAYYAVGFTYMDDNAKRKNTPLYFAISLSLRLFGPMLGFVMSSVFLSYYENPFVDPGFDNKDPRWIGAWWIGFVLQGMLLFIFTIPISMFPRRLPGYGVKVTDKEVFNVSSFLSALKRLSKNKMLIFLTLNTIMSILGAYGHYIMLPKYMETQFRLTSSEASLLSGPPGIGSIMVSVTLGGFIIWHWKPTARFLISWLITVQVIKVISYLMFMLPQCESIPMVNYGYQDELILTDACNFGCNCSTKTFTPVCGPDKRTVFFSPCHAGCKSNNGNKTYNDCACVPEFNGTDSVTEGYCRDDECWSQAKIYIIALPILDFFTSLFSASYNMILLRSVRPEDKSVAMGAFETLLSAFGFIPYPILFGAIVDSACLVWERSCGGTGNCWFYNNWKFNYLLHGASAVFTFFSTIFLVAIYFSRSGISNLYEEDDQEIDTTVKEKAGQNLETTKTNFSKTSA